MELDLRGDREMRRRIGETNAQLTEFEGAMLTQYLDSYSMRAQQILEPQLGNGEI